MKEIENAFSKIILYFPALSPIIFGWEVKSSDEVPTMATDYKRLFYSEDFVKRLTPKELRAVILHEIFHNVFLHPTEITKVQSQGKDPKLWTIALEIVTNASTIALTEETQEFQLPGKPYSPLSSDPPPEGEVYFYDPVGETKTAEEIYEMLIRNEKAKKVCYMLLEGAPLCKDILPPDNKTDVQEAIEKAIAVLEKLQKQQGILPDNLNRLLKKLTTAKVPWHRILHNFVATIIAGADDLSWSRPDFKKTKDIILPGLVQQELEDIVVVVDTSGSISDKALRSFASEIAKLSTYTDELVVITTDAKVHEQVKIRDTRDLLLKLKFKGGGGTDFNDVFNQVKKCQAMVFFTDGYATYPSNPPKYPVLWILTSDHQRPPFGKVAYMLDD